MIRNKTFILIGLFLFSHSFYAQVTKEKKFLVDIIEQLEQEFGCRFSYADKNIESVLITIPQHYTTLQEIVVFLEKSTDLHFKILQDNFITISLKNDDVFICGYLLDIYTNKAIEYAIVQSEEMYAVTDAKGYFELISKDDLISIQHISYKTVQYVSSVFAKNNKCDNYYLVPEIKNIQEVVIQNYLTKGIRKKLDGSFAINYKGFGILPGLIETDVLYTIQAIPGVQSVDETVSNINIRGGSHHENLILWDGIKMYQSGHFFGLISAFNPHITKNATLVKNGTSANYSDGVSGTIFMRSDKEVNTKFKSEIGLNLINIDALFDIPINKKSSVQVATRKSFNNFIKTPTYNSYFDKSFENTEVTNSTRSVISFNEHFSFNDAAVRWLYHISDNDKIRVNLLTVSNLSLIHI